MSATVSEDPTDLFEVLSGTLGGTLEAGRGFNGYTHQKAVLRAGETLARVLYGGSNGPPHIVASGAATDDVVPVIRAAWPQHEVTRMDTAQDFSEPGGYDLLAGFMEGLSASSRLTLTKLESVRAGVRSRTLYLGAPSSRVRVRLYEKGRFEQQQGHEADPHWFRLESQIRPTGKDARQHAARIDATEAWGMARWTRELASTAMGLDVEPITMQARREPDFMRALRNLARQYGATLDRALEIEGSWDAVGALIAAERVRADVGRAR